MSPVTLRKITKAFRGFLNRKQPRSFRVHVTKASKDGKVFFVTMTLRSGFRFCCGEPGCHVGLHRHEDFDRLREQFKAAGVEAGHPLTVHVRWIVEDGVLLTTNRDLGLVERQEKGWTSEWEFAE